MATGEAPVVSSELNRILKSSNCLGSLKVYLSTIHRRLIAPTQAKKIKGSFEVNVKYTHSVPQVS
jgi:hypothetical protein